MHRKANKQIHESFESGMNVDLSNQLEHPEECGCLISHHSQLKKKNERRVYSRVSSAKQKDDLARQKKIIKNNYRVSKLSRGTLCNPSYSKFLLLFFLI